MGDKALLHRAWDRWAPTTIAAHGKPLTGAAVVTVAPDRPFRFSTLVVEQQGLNLKPADVRPLMEGVRDNSLHKDFFSIGPYRYMVTTVDEHLYAARCINSKDAAGAGAIISRTFSYVIIATYQGSCCAATKAVAAIEAFVDHVSPRS